MASIPLPALSVRPPADPTDMVSHALQLKAMIQQQQQQAALMPGAQKIQQQQIQAGALENQSRQQDMDARSALNKAYATSVTTDAQGKASFDPDKLQSTLATGPAAYKTPEVMEGIAKFQKSRVDLQNSTQDLKAKQTDMIGGAASAVKAAGYDPTLAHSLLDSMPPSPQLDQIRGMIDSNPQGFKQMIDSAVAQSPKAAETAKNTAQAAMDAANAQKTTTENANLKQFGGLTPAMAESRYLSVQSKLNQKQAVSPDDMAFKAAYEKNKSLNAVTTFNLQNQGATGTAAKPSPIAQGIADGSIKWNDAISARTPMAVKQAMLAEVKSINPAFKASDFDVEKKVQENFTSGNYSQQLNSINRAREHMGTFLDKAKDLDGGNVQAFNALSNAFSVQFGSDKVGNLAIAKQAFSSEVGKAFAGASVGVTDREELNKAISNASSFQQLAGAAKTADTLLAGAQKALKQTYEAGKQGRPNFGDQPAAGGKITVTAPDGSVHTFPDQASADKFKGLAGIK